MMSMTEQEWIELVRQEEASILIEDARALVDRGTPRLASIDTVDDVSIFGADILAFPDGASLSV